MDQAGEPHQPRPPRREAGATLRALLEVSSLSLELLSGRTRVLPWADDLTTAAPVCGVQSLSQACRDLQEVSDDFVSLDNFWMDCHQSL